jgi:hypothetical protein
MLPVVRRSALGSILRQIEIALSGWAMRKFKKLHRRICQNYAKNAMFFLDVSCALAGHTTKKARDFKFPRFFI